MTNQRSTNSVPDPIVQAAAGSAQTVTRLKGELEAASKAQTIWSRLEDALRQGRWFQVREIIEKESEFFHSLRQTQTEVIPDLEGAYKRAKEQTSELLRSLPHDVELLAERKTLSLDRSSSRHPRYKFREGFITLEIDEAKRTARISTTEGRLATIPCDLDAIARVLVEEDKRLFGRKFNGSAFLKNLRRGYLAVLKKQKGRDGEPVPLRAIAKTFASKNSKFRRDEFVVDLTRLVSQGPAETGGFRFEFQQTKDTDQGILLQGAAGRGMINLLIFRKVTT